MKLIPPSWPAPANVHAAVTTRQGGVSRAPYDSLNLGDHVGDDPTAVAHNRLLLRESLALPSEPHWLSQVHGNCAIDAADSPSGCEADAVFSRDASEVCAVLTADCLPVLLCDSGGSVVAAVHAGWRGLLDGVIENTVARMAGWGEILAWLGPAIGPQAFEVGEEVRQAFINEDVATAGAFAPSPAGRWLADIYALARRRLQRAGVDAIYGGEYCTFSDPERFYSYRRDGVTGRMASLIWME
ncbi:MAG: peptidoglycan editing factor PgeF [Gammaproteobacteria bacterium]|nr:peptidoglycan editing factor PgeF [Gammaproteobacteria bacterium]MCW8993481.1 peptidoglycan editing factor PgeF [Gammaproteobacteria bacterium]